MEQKENVTVQERSVDNRTVVEVQGKFIVLSEVKSRIERSLSNKAIEEVRIYAGIRLIVDANLTPDVWHGRNLVVLANEIEICSAVTWNVSGKDNDHVYTSNAGTSPDGLGEDGRDGYPGESGGNVFVTANTIQNPEWLTIISNGGCGSNGQDGGDGKDGADGTGISRKEFMEKFTNSARFWSSNRESLSHQIKNNMNRLAKNVTHKWHANWLITANGYYLVVETDEGHEITFSSYYTALLYTEAFLLIKGSPGQRGEPGGKYGCGGQGGFPGEISVKRLDDGRTFDTKTRKNGGLDGDDGEGGFNGVQGKNGWDMGFVDFQLNSPTFYGIDEKSKLKLSFYNYYHNNKIRVYCPYKAYHCKSNYAYAEIEESKLEHQYVQSFKERNNTRARSDRQHHSKALGKKAIAKVGILSEFYEYLHQIEQERLQQERQRFENDRASRLAQLEIDEADLQSVRKEQARKMERLEQERQAKEQQRLQLEMIVQNRQRLEQERLEREEQRLEEERRAREEQRLEQERLAAESQQLHQEQIARERERLEQLRIAQDRQRLEQERIAAERQRLAQEHTARENQLLQQIEIAKEKQQMALNQVQTASQALAQLEIKAELQRLEQQQCEMQMQRLRQQIEIEEQQAEQQRIEEENLRLQQQIEEAEEQLTREQITEEEQRMKQNQTDENKHQSALKRIGDERQQMQKQQNEDQTHQLLQRQSLEEEYRSAQQQIQGKVDQLQQQQMKIEEQRLQQINLQYVEDDESLQDIANRQTILNRIREPNITRPLNFSYDSADQFQNFFTILELSDEIQNEKDFFDMLINCTNPEDWLQLRTRLVNSERLNSLLNPFELLKSKNYDESDQEFKNQIEDIKETLKVKTMFLSLDEISNNFPQHHTEMTRCALTANDVARYLEETEDNFDSIPHSVPSALKNIIFENSSAQRANITNFVESIYQDNSFKQAIKAFILQSDDCKNERVKQFYDEYHDFLAKQKRKIDSITKTIAAELHKSQNQDVLNLWNESVRDDSLLEDLEEMIKQNKTLSSLYDKLECEENSEYDWERCCADEKIRLNFKIHLKQEGIMSKSGRVLLAYVHDINIRVYTRNEDKEIVLLEDLNPHSNTAIHILLKVNKFVLLKINESYRQLELERMHKDKIYRRILFEKGCLQNIQGIESYFPRQLYDQSKPMYDTVLNEIDEEVAIKKIADFFPTEERELIAQRLQNISPRYTGQHGVFESILQRFSFEGCHVSSNELCFLINAVLAHSIEKRQERYTFAWIFSAYNQCNWTDELVLLQLENCFKQEKAKWRSDMAKIDNKGILLVFAAQLARNPCSVKSVVDILYLLSNVPIESVILDQLKLTEWPFVLKEYFWGHKLKSLISWDDETKGLSSASLFISSIENIYGEKLMKTFFNLLQLKSDHLTQAEMITILTYYHTQKWILCEDDLNELKKKSIQEWMKHMEKTYPINLKDLDISVLANAIENNKSNSQNIINVLAQVEMTVKKICSNQKYFRSISISTISDSDIKQRAEQFKNIAQKPSIEIYEEMLAFIDRAIELKRGFRLRDTQRLTVLTLLVNDTKTLAQVSTGEGKSLIVVATALIKGLLGQKVDIITSSSVLAQRDATVYNDIYELFGLSAAHNCSENVEERKEAYSLNQIIYGDLANFQRDYLLDRFFGRRLLGDRSFQNVIVDEVDSMLLDKGNNMLYLSHDIAGMDKLESVYVYIWQMLNTSKDLSEDEVVEMIKQSVLNDMYPNIQKKEIQYLDNSLNKSNLMKLWETLVKCGIISNSGRLLTDKIDSDELDRALSTEFTQYKDRLCFLLCTCLEQETPIKVPNYLKPFVERHLDSWISSALSALYMVPGQYYVVDVDRSGTSADKHANIIILDRDTGTDQVSSQWDEALHQFLQLKHGCKLSTQNLKAVFISNVTFLKMYKLLYGLTGTLGSKRERHLLKEIHQVDFVTIPTAKTKQFEEYEPIICSSKEDWKQNIHEEVNKLTIADNRSVLIICETIEDVEALQKSFDSNQHPNVQTYVREYEKFTIDEDGLQPGQIIIATNLAGRGTDIKISRNLEQNGGLHVILTYLPANIRIEEQAFGRSARNGDKGSGRMITMVATGNTLQNYDIYTLKQKRNVEELLRLSSIETYYEITIKTEEDCFKAFNELYGKKMKLLEQAGTPDLVKEILLQSCLDKWSFWLDENNKLIGGASDEATKRKVKLLIDRFLELLNDLDATNANSWPDWVQGNPMQMIKLGKYLAQSEHYNTGLRLFEHVIETEPYFCEAAYYYQVHTQGKMDDREMKYNLRMAKQLFQERIKNNLHASGIIGALKTSSQRINGYKEQKKNLNNLYELFIQSIDELLGEAITPKSFVNEKIKEDVGGKIFQDLMQKGIIKRPEIIDKVTDAQIRKLYTDYFIPQERMKTFLAHYQGVIDENDFLDAIRKSFSFPNRIEFWKFCIVKNVLHSQVEYVVVNEERLNTIDPALMIVIKEKLEEGVLVKEVVKLDFDQILLVHEQHSMAYFEKEKLLHVIGEKKYKFLEDKGSLSFNEKATIDRSKITDCLFFSFNSISAKDIADKTSITSKEANIIIDELLEQNILEKKGDSFALTANYDRDIWLPSYPVYENVIRSVLASCFAYRLALSDILLQLEDEDCSIIQIKLKLDPHRDFFNDLLVQEIIQAPMVTNEVKEASAKYVYSASSIMEDLKELLSEEMGLALKNSEALSLAMIGNRYSLDEIKSCISSIVENHGQAETYDVAVTVEKCVNNHVLLSDQETVYHVVSVLKKSKSKLSEFVTSKDELKSIMEFYGKENFGNIDEMRIFVANGLEHLLERKQMTYRMKMKPLFLALYGMAKVVVGTVMKVLSLGSSFGESLVRRGNGDIDFALDVFDRGNLIWQNFTKKKLRSLLAEVFDLTKNLFQSVKSIWLGLKVSVPGLFRGRKRFTELSNELVDNSKEIVKIMKRAAQVTSEGVSFAVNNMNVDTICESHLKTMLSSLESDILSGLKEEVQNYKVTGMLKNLYSIQGEQYAKNLLEELTSTILMRKSITQAFLPFLQEISNNMEEEIGKIFTNPSTTRSLLSLVNQLSQLNEVGDRIAQVTKICKATRQLLDSINNEIERASIEQATTSSVKTQFNDKSFERFCKTFNKQWESALSSHVKQLIKQHVAQPVLTKATNAVNAYVQQTLDDIGDNMNESESVDTDRQRPRKKKQTKVSQPTMMTATKSYLTKEYHRQLLDIMHKTRSPAQFIAIVRQNVPMDLTCVEVCARVLHKALQAHPGMENGLTIIVHGENDTRHSFCVGSEGLELHLELVNNHFTVYEAGETTVNTFSTNCLYGALRTALPDFQSRGEDEFKSMLNKSFEHDNSMYEVIQQALHQALPHDELLAYVWPSDPSQPIVNETSTQEYRFLIRVAPYTCRLAGQLKRIAEITNYQVSDLLKVGCSIFETRGNQSGEAIEQSEVVKIPILVETLLDEYPDLYRRLTYHAGNTKLVDKLVNVYQRIGGIMGKNQTDWILTIATVDYRKELDSQSKEVFENYKRSLLHEFDSTIDSNKYTKEQVSVLKSVRKIIKNTKTEVLFQQAKKGYSLRYKHESPAWGKRRPIV